MLRTIAKGCAGAAAVGLAMAAPVRSREIAEDAAVPVTARAEARTFPAAHVYIPSARIPGRSEMLARLRKQKRDYDVLVIGGGATGCMAALDAVSRGLRVALVEREDFAAGTSSRSTKLIHGGVRYLEKAVFELDYGQYKLVREALHERSTLMGMAPHLTNVLPIMTPCYRWIDIPMFLAGLTLYDLISGSRMLLPCRWLNKDETVRSFPMINSDGLKSSIVYADANMNDSRMAVGIAQTAASLGATVLNHASCESLIKDPETGKVTGAVVRDLLAGGEDPNGGDPGTASAKPLEVRAKVVINATGPFSDAVLRMDDPSRPPVIKGSAGVHVILPNYYSPSKTGLIVPKTKDGRVVFLLPWLDHTIAGTTDSPSDIKDLPRPREEDIDFVLESLSSVLRVNVRRCDVRAAWSGIRPLVTDPSSANTASISREHIVHTSDSGLVSILGGKWTTARLMAEQGVDAAIRSGSLNPKSACRTESTRLLGADGWSESFFVVLAQSFHRKKSNGNLSPMDTATAKHLSHSYGTRAIHVAELAQEGFGKKLAHGAHVLEAEVVHAIQSEFSCTATDFLARRSRLAFLDTGMALQALPRVLEIMAEQLGWSEQRVERERAKALEFIKSTGTPSKSAANFDDDDEEA